MPTKKPNKTEEIIGKIFKDSDLVYGLKEFEDIKINDVLEIIEDEPNRFYLTDLKSGKKRFVYDEKKNSGRPEEIVRQLWFHKLITHYKYPIERIEVEKSVHFGREVHAKAADLVVYKKDKITPYIIVEVKAPNEKKGEDQLKTYLSAEGAEIGVWANGTDKIILYRPYPREYEALTEIPRADQTIDDLFEVKRKWSNLSPKFDFTKIIRRIEELALAGSGANVFEETFKLIYAKLYDEKLAREKRVDEEVLFKGYKDPQRTYDVINSLFKEAIKEWPDTFELSDKIKLTPSRLNICVPLMAGIRLFELGKEYIIDPACGSGGFMLHTMYHVWDNYLKTDAARKDYAGKYLYGIDFDDNMRRISQALMLIAGDGKHHIFKRDSLDSREWTGEEAEDARVSLKPLLHHFENTESDKENKLTYRHLDFDLVLTNPPFAGENPESGLLRQYELARKEGGKLKNNVERHILFIERALDMLRPGGRMAIVLPQGVLNNTNMEYVREYLFDKARILAVVGLHGNTFKPHTGTKTSVLFLQKWKDKPLKDYPIFMAVSKKGGNYFHDTKGRKVLDHDLDEIADGFLKFAKEEKYNF
ncbi:MAG: type I restriction enzyme, HsdR-HsdM subunit [Parcubacteria group bacterium GW2011_GWC1_36_9]|nr:MAG: type I restriction enzyme, HsdR-HsdM subunit [Parcubacteria group bacterium GW2011_GWC1_36_9]